MNYTSLQIRTRVTGRIMMSLVEISKSGVLGLIPGFANSICDLKPFDLSWLWLPCTQNKDVGVGPLDPL